MISRLKKTVLAVVLLTGSAALFAAENLSRELLSQADKNYEQGNFAQAKDLYEQIVQQKQGGFSLYYNLGNTYYRLGQLGRARLWYERARIERPGDDDLRHNLNLIRAQLQEKEDEGLDRIKKNWRWVLYALFAANIIFFLFLGIGLYRRDEWLWWGRWTAGLAFAVLLMIVLAGGPQQKQRDGIILQPRAEARIGPGAEYRVGFIAPEGQKVVIFNSQDAWIQIGVPEKGLKGWVARESVESISLQK